MFDAATILKHTTKSERRELRDLLIDDLLMEQCPTLCDYDCLDVCHEGHAIPRRRDHDPDDCEKRRGLRE